MCKEGLEVNAETDLMGPHQDSGKRACILKVHPGLSTCQHCNLRNHFSNNHVGIVVTVYSFSDSLPTMYYALCGGHCCRHMFQKKKK